MLTQGTKSDDLGWKYVTCPIPNDKNTTKCNFCDKVCKGGIFRAKEHLIGGCRNAKGCKRCPPSIQEEIREYMKKKNEKRERNMDPIDDDFSLGLGDDDDDDDDVAHNTTRTNTSSGARSNSVNKKPRQKGPMDLYLTPDPEICLQKNKGKQKRLDDFDTAKKELRERVCTSFARWMYDARIPFNAVNYDSFKVFREVLGHYGSGIKPPSFHEVRVPLLKKEVDMTRSAMKDHVETWAKMDALSFSFYIDASKLTSTIGEERIRVEPLERRR